MQMFLICVLFKGRSYYHGQGSLWLQTPVIFFEMRGCQWNSEWPGFPEKITRQSNCKEFQIYCVRHFYLWVWPYHPDQLSQNLEELAHIWFIPNVALFPRLASVAHPPFFHKGMSENSIRFFMFAKTHSHLQEITKWDPRAKALFEIIINSISKSHRVILTKSDLILTS